MVRNFVRHTTSLTFSLLAATFFVGCSGSSGSEDDDPGPGNEECLPDPDCIGCVADGDCCVFSINCQPGRICNQPDAELYDPNLDEDICIRVTCEVDGDCDAGKVCGRDKLCRAPICQTDGDCSGAEKCLNGTCQTAPTGDEVASCAVSNRDGAVNEGGTVTLHAVSKNAAGETIGGVDYDWISSAPTVVSVSGEVATGETVTGTATITAQVSNTNITCAGGAVLSNFAAVPANTVRVVVVEDGVGRPVSAASVTVFADGTASTATTAADGSASFSVAASDVQSVTVEKDGWQLLSVLAPGIDDIFIPLPRDVDVTVAAGIKGSIDLSETRAADIKFGFAGPAIPLNLLDAGAESLIGDILPTEIDSPELGIDDTFPLPAGLLFSIGTQNFTSVPERCLGATPGLDDLGCYLTRMPTGPSAGWALGGQVALSEITGLVNELSGLLGGGTGDIPIGDILQGVLPLLRRFNHGLNASIEVDAFPKVPVPNQSVDCSDPTLPNYDEVCIADFSTYSTQDLKLTQGLNILASVGVPDLPLVTTTSTCSRGGVLLSASVVEGRGLIPLGLGAGFAKGETDCQIAGVEQPFGPGTDTLPDGRMPLSMATPHSGLEGSQTVLLYLAADIDQLIAGGGAGFQVSAILNRVASVANDQTVTGAFLPYPEGVVNKATAEVVFSSDLANTTMVRAELNRDGQSWIVYAPPGERITLPGVATGTEIVGDADGAVLLNIQTRSGVSYGDVWRLGSGTTFDRLFDIIDAFVVTDCPEGDASASCQLQLGVE